MLLFTHTACGVLIACITNNPFTGSLAALASHYIFDIIPHEPKEELFYVPPDKTKRSKEIEDKLKKRHYTSLVDIFLSLIILAISLYYIFPLNKYLLLFIILGFSVLPDILTILAIYIPNKYLAIHHKFHFDIHKIIPMHISYPITYAFQIIISTIMLYFASIF